MTGFLPEEQHFLDEAVARFNSARRTFTDRDALEAAWQAGCEDLTLEYDVRFARAQSRHGHYDPHYRLREHILANNRLLNDLLDGSWDGLYLDARLETLDASEGGHHIFYPHDSRLRQNRQGRWEAAVERNILLEPAEKQELDALAPALLAVWPEEGKHPWSIQEIIAALKQLGWAKGETSNIMLVIRAWLLSSTQIVRVGQDFWLPAAELPAQITRTRLQLMPVRSDHQQETNFAKAEYPDQTASANEPGLANKEDSTDILLSGEATETHANWTFPLRTIHLLEGFLPIPARVRNAYPPLAPGEYTQTVFDAIWTRSGDHFWLWLDRLRHRFYSSGLAESIAFENPGDILHITWEPDIVIIRPTDLNNERVRLEETRLIDVEALKELRADLGESYHNSIQKILLAAPEGLSWQEIHTALSQLQQHEVHRGTILALLHHGGFIQRDKRWFAAPESLNGHSSLRSVLRKTTPPPIESGNEYIRTRVLAIKQRLEEIYRHII